MVLIQKTVKTSSEPPKKAVFVHKCANVTLVTTQSAATHPTGPNWYKHAKNMPRKPSLRPKSSKQWPKDITFPGRRAQKRDQTCPKTSKIRHENCPVGHRTYV
jgi:hypothetical protein